MKKELNFGGNVVVARYSNEVNDNFERLTSILEACDRKSCFIFEGLLILGEPQYWIKTYLLKNPSKSFRTWLIDENIPFYYLDARI